MSTLLARHIETVVNRPLCIYQAHNVDSSAAAWVVRKAFNGAVDFHAASYAAGPPDVSWRDVFVVGFWYPRETLLDMIAKAFSLTVIDNHASAAAALKQLPGAIVRWDEDNLACLLTWKYFFQETPPRIFYALGDSAVVAYVESVTSSLDRYDSLSEMDHFGAITIEGLAMLRKQASDLDRLLPELTRTLTIGGHSVPAANLPPTLKHAAGTRLCVGQRFAAIYWDDPEFRHFYLRSSGPDGAHVGDIAQRFSGGGNRYSAGFRVDRLQAWRMECDE